MESTYFSPSWYRVAELKPCLRGFVRIHRRRYRGHVSYIVQDDQGGRFHRLSPQANYLVFLMDGTHTVEEIWESAGHRYADTQPTQDETIQLLAQLYQANLITGDFPADLAELEARGTRLRRQKLIAQVKNPLAIRLPLFDPENFLSKTEHLARPLLSRTALCCYGLLVLTALLAAMVNWQALMGSVSDRLLSVENLVLMVAVYPLVKIVHELAHAYSVKKWGGEVHEIGVMLLVFFPVPYVDASASSGFNSKWQRAAVASAGIVAEIVLASLALFLWLYLEPGLARAAAFSVFTLASFSTLLFNGNPLLRFDGYYVFSDIAEIPNLGERGNRYFIDVLQRRVLGIDRQPEAVMDNEKAWLLSYAILSFAYRFVIFLGIAIYLADGFFFIGVALALLVTFTLMVKPLLKALRYLLISPDLSYRRYRVAGRAAVVGAALLTLFFIIPLPHSLIVQGEARPPENAHVRVVSSGEIEELLVANGSSVVVGQPLLTMQNLELSSRVEVLALEREQLSLRLNSARVNDRVLARVLTEQLSQAEADLAFAKERIAQLVVTAPRSGRWLAPKSADLVGAYHARGTLLGYVVHADDRDIRAYVPQSEVDLVKDRVAGAEVVFGERVHWRAPADILQSTPGALTSIKNAALTSEGGGTLLVAPGIDGRMRLLESVFAFELNVLGAMPAHTVGAPVWVRFDLGYEAYGWRILRRLRQTFLREFDV